MGIGGSSLVQALDDVTYARVPSLDASGRTPRILTAKFHR
jgi:hypothetical protein